MAELNQIDLRALTRGDKRTWDAFVVAAAPLINAVVRRTLAPYRLSEDDVLDAAQDVFVRLCAQDFRLLKTYDPARAGLPTWLSVVSRSCAIDHLRRRRQSTEPIDDVPEAFLGVEDRHVEKLRIPDGLLTARQVLILSEIFSARLVSRRGIPTPNVAAWNRTLMLEKELIRIILGQQG